jgi:ComF family protein
MMNATEIIKKGLSGLMHMAYPETCLCCGQTLNMDETCLCHDCLWNLPATNNKSKTENSAAIRFFGKIPFEKCDCFYYYKKGSTMQTLIELMKYKGYTELCEFMGHYTGVSLNREKFFEDIDIIVPVPLHPSRYKKRGYNQSEMIARGLSKAGNIPVDSKTLIRKTGNQTQTKRSIYERWKNVSSIFAISDSENFENKHILIVDDVLTSGSTLEACGSAILKAGNSKISFFTLAQAL